MNKVCNAGQGQFSRMQWKWKSIKEAMFKGLEQLTRGESKKAGETKVEGKENKDL